MSQQEALLEAYQYGRSACECGMPAVPALDQEFLGIIPRGSEAPQMVSEWLRGWHEANRIKGVDSV